MSKNQIRQKQLAAQAHAKKRKEKKAALKKEHGGAPFNIRQITGLKKNAPTWGLMAELAKSVRGILQQYVRVIDEMQTTTKYKYFAALADRGLFAYAETTLSYIRRDFETWERTIENVMDPVKGRFGKLYSQEDMSLWLSTYDQLESISEAMRNTTTGAYALYDTLFNNFTYSILGLSIPEYLLLDNEDQRAAAEITFTNAINNYNKENPENLLPGFNEFYTAVENKSTAAPALLN